MSDIPEATPEPGRAGRALSLIWLAPVAALGASAYLVWQNYEDRGRTVEITFASASGVQAGETQLRYRDVAVGVVEAVGFTDDLERVVVTLRVQDEVAPFLDDDATFYVVRPEIGPRGVSGIETVLSGVYIEGRWDLDPEGFLAEHAGAEGEPLGDPARGGLSFTLIADGDGGLAGGVPIFYRGVEVGEVGTVELDPQGLNVRADAVIFAPYDDLVTEASRFYDASGFAFSLGARGASLDVENLASLVSGGIVLDTVVTSGQPAPDGAEFRLFPDREAARRSAFDPGGPADALRLTAIFEGEVSGLRLGAPVELRGLEVGRVAALRGIVDEEVFGDSRVRLLTTLELQPGRIGLEGGEDALDFIERRVEDGLRARLVTASILTGGLKVQIADVPGAEPAALERAGAPFPVLPTAPADVSDVTASATGLFDRLAALPIDDLIDAVVGVAEGASRIANSPDTQAIPGEVRGLVAEARAIAASEGAQRLPGVTAAAVEDLSLILAEIRDREVVEAFEIAADSVYDASDDVLESIVGVPELIAEITTLAAELREVPAGDLVTEATGLLASLDAVVDQDSVRALPAEFETAIASLRRVAEDIAAQELAARIGNTLDAAATAVDDIGLAAEGAPDLVAALTELADELRTVPVAEIGASAAAGAARLEALLADEALAGVPADVAAATAALRTVAEGVAAQDLAPRLDEALTFASAALANVGIAAEGAAPLIDALTAVANDLREVPLGELGASAGSAAARLDALLADEALGTLPADVAAAAGALRQVTEQIAAQDLAARLDAALVAAEAALADVGTAVASAPDLIASLGAVADEAAALPLAEIGASAAAAAARIEALLADESLGTVPADVSAAAGTLRRLAGEVEARGIVAGLSGTLGAAEAAAADVAAAAEGAPALIESLTATSDAVHALPLDRLAGQAGDAVAALNLILDQDAARALPAELRATLADVGLLTGDLVEAGAAANLSAALEAAADAAAGIDTAARDVPELVENLTALSRTARDLPLDELVTRASALVGAAEGVVGTEAAAELPARLNGALEEVAAVLAEVRAGGTVETLNGTLGAASSAAENVSVAAARLPETAERLDALLTQAGSTLATYDARSDIARGALQAIRDIQGAADAFASLARAIERRPNSLIVGR